MDTVRFGRALGMGARQATKALVAAADAAASPSPSPNSASSARESAPQTAKKSASAPAATLNQKAARTTEQVRQTKEGLARGSKRFGEAMWGPLAKLSGVLALELSGVFFGLFLVPALANAWNLRTNLRDTGLNHSQHVHLLWSMGMAAVFGYFCISSFVMAARRQRRS